ncbi:uncharacterized protein LOC124413403 [Diprion similis]|uniref:uncharacterized protein LOC124413403 n=1 Tax=Diprion similis TaxID=362088 RepID=UPI001EF7CF1E|nr:uncharacterized protein LOC124413403 [Diprion similis]
MAVEQPDWLDAYYVQKVLRKAEMDESIEVFGITVKPATAKGDNCTSDMHRVSVEFSRGQKDRRIQEMRSIIVKVAPQDLREKLIESMGIFDIELSMMSTTLPKMQEILGTFFTEPLGARCLYHQIEKPTHIVIEDLTPKGFKMAHRRLGLDLSHSVLVVRNLARFHASSIALREKDLKAIDKYKKGIFHKDHPIEIRKLLNANVRSLAKETANWSELNPRIPEKLLKLFDVMYEKACEVTLYREDDFNVLNHGDLWVNNVMFRYDNDQKPVDHIFVDFQFCHWGSPTEDLLFFFGSSLSDDVRVQHRDSLIREYQATLTTTISKLKCKTEPLSFENLQALLERRAFYEVIASITKLASVVFEEGEEFDFEEKMKVGEEYVHPGYRGKNYRKIMTRLLPLYDSMGLLDM